MPLLSFIKSIAFFSMSMLINNEFTISLPQRWDFRSVSFEIPMITRASKISRIRTAIVIVNDESNFF